MNAFTSIQDLVMPLPLETRGYSVAPSAQSPRLLELTVARETVAAFVEAVAQWPVQALEYKSFLRFRVAQILDELCEGTLRPVLLNTILDRGTGAVCLATAILLPLLLLLPLAIWRHRRVLTLTLLVTFGATSVLAMAGYALSIVR